MKKLFIIAMFVCLFSTSIFAQSNSSGEERDEAKWTTINYTNVPVLKVLEAKEGYIIIYQKNRVGVGTVELPKKWAKGTTEDPRKLKFRAVNTAQNAYMTVVRDGSDFKRVILSIPMNKQNSLWGISKKALENPDKDSLEDLEY